MKAKNKLVIVRDADETLRIPFSKRLQVKLTQAMSDEVWMRHTQTANRIVAPSLTLIRNVLSTIACFKRNW